MLFNTLQHKSVRLMNLSGNWWWRSFSIRQSQVSMRHRTRVYAAGEGVMGCQNNPST